MKHFFRKFDNVTSQALTGRFADSICRDVDISEPIVKALQAGDWADLCSRSVVYHYSSSVSSLIGERQILGLFAKNLDLPLKVDRKKVAYDKFIESETVCRATNRRFRSHQSGLIHFSPRVESVFLAAQRKIADVLGPVPDLDTLQLVFGPGANSNVKKNTSARWKLSSPPACSANMLSVISDVLSELPMLSSLWADSDDESHWVVPVTIQPGELMFVAKNAKTDRSIIVEPSCNTLVQKGIGTYMKHRLRQHGVNLFDQSEAKTSNRQRALRASISDDYMTIDLSSASDTIAKLLVLELLPYEWYEFLSSIRTSRVVCKDYGLDIELEKFSSMGNGFTFELETLIFYALSRSCCIVEGIIPDVAVYGDDIIAPSSIYDLLKEVFDIAGFEINSEKSYISGPFRESCGGDYFLGQSVRPYYQKSNWSYGDLYSFHNFLVRTGMHFILPELYKEVLNAIPVPTRLWGPDGFGDGHLIGDWQPKRHKTSRGWGGWTFLTRTQVPRRLLFGLLPGDFILPFYSAYVSSGGSDHYSVRGASGRVREVRVYTLSRQ